VIDGEVLRGDGFMAGHLGHLLVRRGGRRCACGARGCLEAYASNWALRRALGMDARDAVRAARAGDGRAKRALDEAADALGTAFADIAHTVNPSVIAVGGGIGRGFRHFAPRALARFEDRALPGAVRSTRIVPAALGNDAGLVGATLL